MFPSPIAAPEAAKTNPARELQVSLDFEGIDYPLFYLLGSDEGSLLKTPWVFDVTGGGPLRRSAVLPPFLSLAWGRFFASVFLVVVEFLYLNKEVRSYHTSLR